MDQERSPIDTSSKYREDLALSDGTRIRVRSLQRSDRAEIAHGFARLSSSSRYMRFLTPKQFLSDEDLTFLTELDGSIHFGLVAVRLARDGAETDGIAVARFFRLPGESDVAEPAITVIDEMQGRGIGSLLLSRLAAAAVEKGVCRFRCYLLSENFRGQEMIRKLFPGVHFQVRSEVVVADFPLCGREPFPSSRFSQPV
jgi:GNAT superfamily N-acetyltransferase